MRVLFHIRWVTKEDLTEEAGERGMDYLEEEFSRQMEN